jgi:general stress protein 26
MSNDNTLQNKEAIDKFRQLVKEVNICMFTTLDENQNILSRPMSTIEVDDEGNAWFFTNEFSEKIQEVSKDNVVNLIYSHPGKNTYVNVTGTCTLVIDPKKMEELWNPSMKEWFPLGIEDPKMCLLKVNTDQAFYWNSPFSKVGLLFKTIASIAKGDKFKEGETGKLDLSQ